MAIENPTQDHVEGGGRPRRIDRAEPRKYVDSLLAAAVEAQFPVFVTTADNVLPTPAATRELVDGAEVVGTTVAIAFTRRASVLAVHPAGQRRFYAFSDDSYSTCNSYWARDRQALDVAEVFRGGASRQASATDRSGVRTGKPDPLPLGIGTLDEAFTGSPGGSSWESAL